MSPARGLDEERRDTELPLVCSLAAGLLWGWCAAAEEVYWNFNTLEPAVIRASQVTVGAVTRANGGAAALLSGQSPSENYAAASGSTNLQALARTGSLSTNDSTFFEVTLTPSAGCRLSVTNLAFGTRSTATGPTAYCVRADTDGFATDLACGAIEADSLWALKTHVLSFRAPMVGQSVTMRLYGHGGTPSGSYNWRIDDLRLDVEAIGWDALKPKSVMLLK